MKHFLSILFALLAGFLCTSCEAIGAIFQTGVGVGVILVVAVILIIAFIFRRMGGKK